MPNNLESLYKAVSGQYDIGTYDEFESKMKTADDRKRFYDAVGESGFGLGNYDEYEQRLASDFPKDEEDPGFFTSVWNSLKAGIVSGVGGAMDVLVPAGGYVKMPGLGPSQRTLVRGKDNKLRPVTDEEIVGIQNEMRRSADKVREKAQEFSSRVEQFDRGIWDNIKAGNLLDAGKQIVYGVTESTGQMLPMIADVPSGIMTVGISSVGQQAQEMREEVRKGKANYTPAEIAGTSLAFGGFEIAGDILTGGLFKGAKGLFNKVLEKYGKEGLEKFSRSFVRETLVSMGKEPLGEVVTQVGQNISANVIAGKDVSPLEGAADAAILGLAFAGKTMGQAYVAGKALGKISSMSDKQKIRENNARLSALEKQKQQPNISEDQKAVLTSVQESILQDNADVITKYRELAPKLNEQERSDLVDISNRIQAGEDLISDPNILPESKAAIEEQMSQLESKREEILNIANERIETEAMEAEKEVEPTKTKEDEITKEREREPIPTVREGEEEVKGVREQQDVPRAERIEEREFAPPEPEIFVPAEAPTPPTIEKIERMEKERGLIEKLELREEEHTKFKEEAKEIFEGIAEAEKKIDNFERLLNNTKKAKEIVAPIVPKTLEEEVTKFLAGGGKFDRQQFMDITGLKGKDLRPYSAMLKTDGQKFDVFYEQMENENLAANISGDVKMPSDIADIMQENPTRSDQLRTFLETNVPEDVMQARQELEILQSERYAKKIDVLREAGEIEIPERESVGRMREIDRTKTAQEEEKISKLLDIPRKELSVSIKAIFEDFKKNKILSRSIKAGFDYLESKGYTIDKKRFRDYAKGRLTQERLLDVEKVITKGKPIEKEAKEVAKRPTQRPKKKVVVDEYAALKGQIQMEDKAARAAVREQRKDVDVKLGAVKEKLKSFLNENRTKLTPRQYQAVINKLQKAVKTELQYDRLMKYIDNVIADAKYADRLLRTEDIRKQLARKIKTQDFRKKFAQQMPMMQKFASIRPSELSANELTYYEFNANQLLKGRITPAQTQFANKFRPEAIPEKVDPFTQMIENVKDFIGFKKRIENARDDIKNIKEAQDVLRLSRRLEDMRIKAGELHLEGKITDDDLANLIFDISQVENRELSAIEQQIKDELVNDITFDRRLIYPESMRDGTRQAVQDIISVPQKELERLPLHTLADMYNALWNLNRGEVTQQVFSVQDQIKINRVKEGTQQFRKGFKEARKKWKSVSNVAKNYNKLVDKLNLKNAYIMDYTFGTEKAAPVYSKIFKPIENAEAAMDAKVDEATKDFTKALNKLYQFKSKGSKEKSLTKIGLLMDELQYRTNKIVVKEGVGKQRKARLVQSWRDVPKEFRNKYGWLLQDRESIGKLRDSDVVKDIREAYNEFTFDQDGTLNIKESIKNLSAEERDVYNTARKTFDILEGINEANTIRRGRKWAKANNYYPNFLLGKTTKGGIEVAQNNIDFTYANPFAPPTKIAGSVYEKTFEINYSEPNIAKVIERYTRELTRDFYMNPAFKQVNGGLQIAIITADVDGDIPTSTALNAIKTSIRDRMMNAFANRFAQQQGMGTKFEKQMLQYSRNILLGSPLRVGAELPSNLLSATITNGVMPKSFISPEEKAKWDSFIKDIGSPFMNKVQKFTELQDLKNKSRTQKSIDAVIQFSDTFVSRPIYRERFKERFKELTGREFDIDKALADQSYLNDFSEEIREASAYGERMVQEEFNTITRTGAAPQTKLFPGAKNISKDSWYARSLSFMTSFATEEAAMAKIAITQMKRGNYKRGAELLGARIIRNASYSFLRQSLNMASLAAIGVAVDWDELFNWENYGKNVTQGMGSLLVGRYANIWRPVSGAVLSAMEAFEEEFTDDTVFTDDLVEMLKGVAYTQTLRRYNSWEDFLSYIMPAAAVTLEDLLFSSNQIIDVSGKIARGELLDADEQERWNYLAALCELITFFAPNPFTPQGKKWSLKKAKEAPYKYKEPEIRR